MFFETNLTQSRIAQESDLGVWPDTILHDLLVERAALGPDKPAIVDSRRTLTFSELLDEVERCARALLTIGVGRGDVVQIQLPNWAEFAVTMLATERIGGVVNPVAPIFRFNEVRVMSELARPSVVVTTREFRGFEYGPLHQEVREVCPWVREVILVDGTGHEPDCRSWEDLMATGGASPIDSAHLDLLRPGPNEVCEVQFTSGTTGQPKGVMHTQNTLGAPVALILKQTGRGPDDVFHMASTLAHQTGYVYGLRVPLTSGSTTILQDVWEGQAFADLIEQHGITNSMGATPFLADLLAVPGIEERDIGSFRVFICAGAAIPRPVLEAASEKLPCTVLPGWGMTECALFTTGRVDDSFEKRLTDGRPPAGCEVRVVDGKGAVTDIGVEGDLEARGSLMFVGYIQGRELTDSCHDAEGWFDTGDRAFMDADGYIRISGRTKDIVIRGGENVPVKEVEDTLMRHPSVANVAIVAKPHDRLGEIGLAFVIPSGDAPTLAELADFLAEQDVTKQFWPEELVIVDEFPMTPSGKVQKFKLRGL
ncbi:MAG: AMP-binding protein [Actinomycetia bacterium]|nr:AMP-binding protein [Actinomycetes bacterium]